MKLNIEALIANAWKILAGSPPKERETIWGGFTTKSFPPVEMPDGRVIVLRRWTRTGERGQLLWFHLERKGNQATLVLALQLLE